MCCLSLIIPKLESSYLSGTDYNKKIVLHPSSKNMHSFLFKYVPQEYAFSNLEYYFLSNEMKPTLY